MILGTTDYILVAIRSPSSILPQFYPRNSFSMGFARGSTRRSTQCSLVIIIYINIIGILPYLVSIICHYVFIIILFGEHSLFAHQFLLDRRNLAYKGLFYSELLAISLTYPHKINSLLF